MRALLSVAILLTSAVPVLAVPPSSVPEPATLPLMAIGVAAALYIARRGKK
jgi:hypothetical protein